jgi:hypothetical protein
MLTTIRTILSGILEGIIATKQYNANKQISKYLSRSVDHADLKKREQDLKNRGVL